MVNRVLLNIPVKVLASWFPLQAEDSIVAGTSEGKVYQFQLLVVKMGMAEHQWVRTNVFQHHTHDVRAVVHTTTQLISGGIAQNRGPAPPHPIGL